MSPVGAVSSVCAEWSGGPFRASARWCDPCHREQWFEVPPCEDGHGDDCLDLACVECGHAIAVGALPADAQRLPSVKAA